MGAGSLFSEINEVYGRYIWKVANRYATYTLSPGDIFDEILLLLHASLSEGSVFLDQTPRIKSIIISKSIDLCRSEIRHFRTDAKTRHSFDVSKDRRSGRRSFKPDEPLQDDEFRDHLLHRIANKMDLAIISEVIWPSPLTYELARRDAEDAAADSKSSLHIRMNCSDPINPRVMKKHIAKSLGVSAARVSQALKRAAEHIHELLGEKTDDEICLQSNVARGDLSEESCCPR